MTAEWYFCLPDVCSLAELILFSDEDFVDDTLV